MQNQPEPLLPLSESGFAACHINVSLDGLPAVQNYPAGIELHQQGASTQDAYWVVSGVVKLTAIGPTGDQIVIGVRPSGRVIGLGPVLLSLPQVSSATTVGLCSLRRVPSEWLLGKMAADRALTKFIHEELSRESYDQSAQVSRLSTMQARSRLLQVLLQVAGAGEIGPTGQLWVPPILKQWEIAQLAGITPQHLNVLLKELERECMLRREKGRVILYHSAALKKGPIKLDLQ